ncbi:glycosyltransferase [Bacillus sp. 1P10SD]|uniref:glycosyltransferase family 2 protein n=1 Tax=Bacillus sp. 1P10SD TaxID=3132265 RepID=UPI0039A47C2B
MSVKVSVIIPVYNAEKYISQCIESLLAQTLVDCEFIFINDGSIDRSHEIIQEYTKKDNRIRLIEQNNQGVSSARNKGLSIAAGEYIGFVDADDYISEDMFKVLYNSAVNGDCDIVISNFESRMEGKRVFSHYPFNKNIILDFEYIQKNIIPYFLSDDNLNSVCTKLIRKSLISQSNVQFPVGVALGEDGVFCLKCFSKAEKIKFIDYMGYFYREVEGSATRSTYNKDYFKSSLEVYQLDIYDQYFSHLDLVSIKRLKAIKLIRSVMAYVFIYFSPNKELSFYRRYKYIKNMITHTAVREAIKIYINEKYKELGRYEKLLIRLIKRKSVIGIYCATSYSRMRNK